MKDTAKQIGRLFTIEKPSIICDIETKTEMPHHSAQNDVEVYPGNFHEHKHELLKYRIEKRNAYLPNEHILPTEHEVKQELKFIEKYIKHYESEPEQINNWLRYYEPKNYRVLLEMYRDYLLEQLKETETTGQQSGRAKLKANKHPGIFKNDFAYTLFRELHEDRKYYNLNSYYTDIYILMSENGELKENLKASEFQKFLNTKIFPYELNQPEADRIRTRKSKGGTGQISEKHENLYIRLKARLKTD